MIKAINENIFFIFRNISLVVSWHGWHGMTGRTRTLLLIETAFAVAELGRYKVNPSHLSRLAGAWCSSNPNSKIEMYLILTSVNTNLQIKTPGGSFQPGQSCSSSGVRKRLKSEHWAKEACWRRGGEGKGPGDSFQRGERMMGKVALCLRLPECNLNRLGVAKEEGT